MYLFQIQIIVQKTDIRGQSNPFARTVIYLVPQQIFQFERTLEASSGFRFISTLALFSILN